jgi:N-acyl-D-amino-acid deacylase
VLTPGFIDMHAHSDLQLLAEPGHLAKVSQGITCEVIGQDGLSYAPVDEETLVEMRRQIAGWNDDPGGFDCSWRTVGEYLDRLDAGIAVNAVYLVPQGTLRRLVVGAEDRPAAPAELDEMRMVLDRSLREGAAGLSAGLTYTPGMFASDEELLALLEVTAQHGGYFSTHHRSYGVGALEAYAEMLDLCRRASCSLHLTHATLNFPVNRGRAPDLVAMLDAALAAGQDVTLDSYPYLPGATTLASLLPSWASAGGTEATLRRLTDRGQRERIREHLEEVGSDGWHGVLAEWDTVVVSGVTQEPLRPLVGRTLADIALERGQAPAEVFFDVLVADGLRTSILQLIGNEENVRELMQHRVHCVGSDAILVGDRPHPRAWGTFPRVLGHYVRELGLLSLEEAVHHMTGRPAARLRLAGRGVIAEGNVADLVLLDPARVADTATFEAPRQRAAGIEHVLVGGRATIVEGRATGDLPGRALRRSSDTGEVA